MSINSLTHLDAQGRASMVDVSAKQDSVREARASAWIEMQAATLALLTAGDNPKGDVFAVSRIAGIQAAKRCADLIPLCHPLMLTKVSVDFGIDVERCRVNITSMAKLTGKTGVEMEALCAASVAALTIYDMCKAVDKGMVIGEVKLLAKSGGKSGDWEAGS